MANDAATPQTTFDQFLTVDIRVGRIVSAEPFPEARKPACRLTIDFGPAIGLKRSSAQITQNYRLDDLPGRLVLAVVNFPPRQIGPMMSACISRMRTRCGDLKAQTSVILQGNSPYQWSW
jgi:tRNA-binding protein